MTAKTRAEDAARAAKTVADQWRITFGFNVTESNGRLTFRLTIAEAEKLYDYACRGRDARFVDDNDFSDDGPGAGTDEVPPRPTTDAEIAALPVVDMDKFDHRDGAA